MKSPQLPPGWERTTLGDLADSVKNGIYVSRPGAEPDGIPILRIGAVRPMQLSLQDLRYTGMTLDEVKRVDGLAHPGDLLVTRYNGNPQLVGACARVPDDAPHVAYPDKLIRVVLPKDKADSRFIAFAWTSADVQAQVRSHVKTTAGQTGISGSSLKTVSIPLPPLVEQKRIAQVIDRVDTLRAKRREAIAILDELAQAFFLDTFGDSVTNPFGWEVARLGEMARIVRGASPRPKGDPRYFGGEIPWLMISDVTRATGDTVSQIREGVTEAGRDKSVFLKSGTLILTNSATVGVPKFLGVDSCIHDGFLAFLDVSSQIDPFYLYYFFVMNRHRISSLAPEGTQKNLNTGIAKSLQIPVPAMELQLKFKAQVATLNELRAKLGAHLDSLDALFEAIRFRAFRGELWAEASAV